MCRFVKIKRAVVKIIVCMISLCLTACIFEFESGAENIIEHYFTPDSIDREETVYSDFVSSLPEEIRENLPDNLSKEPENAADFSNLWVKLVDVVKKNLFPAIVEMASVFALLLISSLIRTFIGSSEGGTAQICGTAVNIGMILCIISTGVLTIKAAEEFKNLICNIMNGMVPALGVIYTASGNLSTGAVQSGGIMLLVALCQNLFSIVLMPAVRICLLFGIVDSIFPEVGVKPILVMFKNIATWIMIISVTLFSFVLGLQNTIAQSADSFGARSIRFAVGNLVPIIGGAVSDSLGTLSGSLSVLKSAGGSAAIIAVILIIAPSVVGLLLRQLVLFLCRTAAGVMKCTDEEKLLGELGSVTSMMLAFAVAISVAFIYMLTLFTGSVISSV